ncbi:unnamed protein product [Ceutorhynchus assimilis]|uniref:Major facilitator superfamily (MFS) profile domain-containing protein n=1 Tax=Ceutorhynchus assimilis TaxID=467358 RepID=A0A9N9MJB1_9CUCU|nr:unnamed protein product [Ceutorhynchus assimilis]
MMAVSRLMEFTWDYMIVIKDPTRYKSWCMLNEKERLDKMIGKIPWYNTSEVDGGPRYEWTQENSRYLNNIQLVGTLLSTVPAGVLAENIGPYYLLLYATPVVGILNSLRVLFLSMDWIPLFISELFIGMHLGLIYPALFVWIARWARPQEIGIFVASNIGNGLAAAISDLLLRYLSPTIGWRSFYYSLSGIIFLFVGLLWFLGSNSPETHNRISAREIYHIKTSQRGKVTPTKTIPPYGRILTSTAFWAVNILCFGTICSDTFFEWIIGEFLFHVLGITLRLVELLEFLPYLCKITGSIIVTCLADFLRSKEISNDTTIARLYAVFSHIVPGCAIIFLSMVRCHENLAIIFFFVAYTLSCCNYISVYRVIIDIAPNYAGTIYGMVRVWNCIAKIVIPQCYEFILTLDNGIIGWCLVFLLGGGCVLGTGVIFLFFGQGRCQWWNLKSADRLKTFQYRNPDEPSSSAGSSIQAQ